MHNTTNNWNGLVYLINSSCFLSNRIQKNAYCFFFFHFCIMTFWQVIYLSSTVLKFHLRHCGWFSVSTSRLSRAVASCSARCMCMCGNVNSKLPIEFDCVFFKGSASSCGKAFGITCTCTVYSVNLNYSSLTVFPAEPLLNMCMFKMCPRVNWFQYWYSL